MNAEEATGKRVEDILEQLAENGDSPAADAAEELVRALMDFYGTGIERIVALLTDTSGRPTPQLRTLLDDEVVAGLLTLHDLHPEDTAARIRRALEAAGAGTFTVEGFEEPTGVLRLLSQDDGGCGCPSTANAARERIEAALSCHAPEVVSVELSTPESSGAQPALLQIGPRPPGTDRPETGAGHVAGRGR